MSVTARPMMPSPPMQLPDLPDEVAVSDELRLRRPGARGTPVRLGDGNEWIVPHIGFVPLRAVRVKDETGADVWGAAFPKEIAADLDHVCDLFLDRTIGEEITGSEWPRLFGLFFHVLHVNYPELTEQMIEDFGLFTTEHAGDFLSAMAGLKKKSGYLDG